MTAAPLPASVPLAGLGIVVTRPREQAAALGALIEAAGGAALLFPAIEIEDLPERDAPLGVIDRLERFELAVFVSPNAVRKGLELVRRRRGAVWPAGVRVAAIGAGTRRALELEGIAGVIAPAAQADSEALLALPELVQVAGKRVVVFRGAGGRELLGDTLAQRGAHVEFAACYRRVRPAADARPLLEAWAQGALHAVTVSSGEGLANLCGMLGAAGLARLQATPLFVPHARIAEQAGQLGVREVRLGGAGDAETLAALVAYFRGAK